MKLLAVDTATESCAVAVTEHGALISELVSVRRQTHARHLLSMIDDALKLANCEVREMDGFAVTRGPGSFTGLRIGISTVKGLAMACGKPVVGVSSLGALAARMVHARHPVLAAIDARKKEVYCALFDSDGGDAVARTPERVASPESAFGGIDRPHILIGSGVIKYREIIKRRAGDFAIIPSASFHVVRAATVAAMAHERFVSDGGEDPAALLPSYIRKSDAELNFGGPTATGGDHRS